MTPAEIRAARERLGLTQAQLARLLETDPTSVQRWETDPASNRTARKPPPRAVQLLKAYLAGYQPDDWPGPKYHRPDDRRGLPETASRRRASGSEP